MKGQFFIIAGVIIVSILSVIFQYFYDFIKINASINANFYERNYIYEIKESYLNIINSSNCAILDEELTQFEKDIFLYLISQGILFNASHSIQCPGTILINYSISSDTFKSNTSFSIIK